MRSYSATKFVGAKVFDETSLFSEIGVLNTFLIRDNVFL